MWEIEKDVSITIKLVSFRIQFNESDEPYNFTATGEFCKSTITIFCS
jgi:hypothetical protein